ncbi:MAG: class I SAM-dependent methyltransferase [Dehalococcoidia bacterium]|nr:class I SAM-dependent methyltransferase [Dehalococcoidia bacterium]
MSDRENPFDLGDEAAAEYDAWYDTPEGRAVLQQEARCVGELLAGAPRPWLEVGTGTGRFGGELGADACLDPSRGMLRLASRRLPAAVLGTAEALPFRDGSVGGVFCVAALEFLPAPGAAFAEVARVLRPGGRAVFGFFAREGLWARMYRELGQDPASVFHRARFYSLGAVQALGEGAGLAAAGVRATLFEPPGTPPSTRVEDEAAAGAGFAAIALQKPPP